MILSRGAMKRFAQVAVECTIASQDCYLDDVRLFFCLRDIGIHLNGSIEYPAMNFAPNKHIDWGRIDPCTRPVVFHGVSCLATHADTLIYSYGKLLKANWVSSKLNAACLEQKLPRPYPPAASLLPSD